MLRPTKILVPTDFSGYSDYALRQALDIAEEYGAEVHVLHVVEERIHLALGDEEYGDNISPQTIQKMQTRHMRVSKEQVEKQIQKASPKQGVKVIPEVVLGIPQVEILRYQEEKKIDLVVISSLGHTALAKYFLGSVARIVLKGSTCPVLLTKGNASE